MDAKLNQGKWRDMEKSWVDLLNNGHTLEVNINISYPNGKNRPSQFIVDYYIDGNTNIRKIFNN